MSLIETTVATVLVSITLVASLNTMAFVLKTTSREAESQRSTQIAQWLLAEITSRPFADPVNATGALGREADETGQRALWDDCDDYHGWNPATLTLLDGSALPGANGWAAQVNISYCNPSDPNTLSGSETNLKRITVSLLSPRGATFTFVSLRCRNGPLLNSQAQGSSVLANVDLSLTAAGKSLSSGARLQNQQESN